MSIEVRGKQPKPPTLLKIIFNGCGFNGTGIIIFRSVNTMNTLLELELQYAEIQLEATRLKLQIAKQRIEIERVKHVREESIGDNFPEFLKEQGA